MPKSIEHSSKFHMVRRIAATIAPDFRILARKELAKDESCLDLTASTIEVSETTTEFSMVGAVLFHLGHLRLRNQEKYAAHFGKINNIEEAVLVETLSRLGFMADLEAKEWAREVFLNNFNVNEARVDSILASHIWNENDWLEYYSIETKR